MDTSSEKNKQNIDIALLKQGDSRVFGEFVSLYQDMVFACCRAVGLREDQIEDAASETFMAAYTSIKTYHGKSKLSSWLWKIAYHKALDYRRKEPDKNRLEMDMVETVPALSTTPDINLSDREQNTAVWETVQQLPQPQAAIIVLFYREGKSVDDIAAILEIPENTVKTCLHRGRKELYTRLQSIWEINYVRE